MIRSPASIHGAPSLVPQAAAATSQTRTLLGHVVENWLALPRHALDDGFGEGVVLVDQYRSVVLRVEDEVARLNRPSNKDTFP